jgi:hypothetical protein
VLLDLQYSPALVYGTGEAVVQKGADNQQGKSSAQASEPIASDVVRRHALKSLDQLIIDESCRMFVRSVETEVVPEMRRAMGKLFDTAIKREKSGPAPV